MSQGMARPNACVTHGKPCVHMHANGHAYKWDMFVEEGGGSRKGKEKGRKGEKGKGEKKKRKERKRKRKRERGRRSAVSSSIH